MTKEEKRIEINKLNGEIIDIFDVIRDFDKNNPNDVYSISLRKIESNSVSYYSVRIEDEILVRVIEMLEKKLSENNKRRNELLGEEND